MDYGASGDNSSATVGANVSIAGQQTMLKQQSSGALAVSTATTSAVVAMATAVSGVLAREALPGSIPRPPDLPNSWPPVPRTVNSVSNIVQSPPLIDRNSANAGSSSSGSGGAGGSISYVEDTLDLPAGYYIASPVPGLVSGFGRIVPFGVTTSEQIDAMNLLISNLMSHNESDFGMGESKGGESGVGVGGSAAAYDDDYDKDFEYEYEYDEGAKTQFQNDGDRDKFIQGMKNRLSISHLPLPGNFYGEIQRMKTAQKLKDDRKAFLESIEMRNYGDFHTAKKGSPKSKKPVKPLVVEFNVDKRYESKDYTFRKPATHTDADNLPLVNHYESKIFKATAAVNGKDHLVNASWISDLRSDTGQRINSNSNTLVSGNRILKKSQGHITKGSDGNSTVVSDDSSSFDSSFHFDDTFDNITDHSSQDSSIVVTRGGMIKCYRKHNTVGKAPVFSHDAVLERRKKERESRKQREDEERNQQLEEEKNQKQRLHQKAVDSALRRGAFDPSSSRVSSIDKMVAKYAQSPRYAAGSSKSLQIDVNKVSTQLKAAELEYHGVRPVGGLLKSRGSGGGSLIDDNISVGSSNGSRMIKSPFGGGFNPSFSFDTGADFKNSFIGNDNYNNYNHDKNSSSNVDDNAYMSFLDSGYDAGSKKVYNFIRS